jgi:hypothetical protein
VKTCRVSGVSVRSATSAVITTSHSSRLHVVPGVGDALARVLAGRPDHRLGDLADLLGQLQHAQEHALTAVEGLVGSSQVHRSSMPAQRSADRSF